MIYLKTLRHEKISIGIKKDDPEAMYNERNDRIIILHSGYDIIGTINHEFMHRILIKNRLYKASACWDNDFIFNKVEKWLGWERYNIVDILTSFIKKLFKFQS